MIVRTGFTILRKYMGAETAIQAGKQVTRASGGMQEWNHRAYFGLVEVGLDMR